MIRGEIKGLNTAQHSIAIQAECFYDKKGIWKFSKYRPVLGARKVLYTISWNYLYTIFVITFNRKLNDREQDFFKAVDYPIFNYLTYEKGMRADFFSKMYDIDYIVHQTDLQLSTGIKFKGWYNLLDELF